MYYIIIDKEIQTDILREREAERQRQRRETFLTVHTEKNFKCIYYII